MTLGEKLFEDEGKTTGLGIKSTGPEGVTMELNFAGEGRGLGRLRGVRVKFFGTATTLQSPTGAMTTNFRVLLTTDDGQSITLSGDAHDRMSDGKLREIGLVRFSTASQRYAWLNGARAVRESEASADFQSFNGAMYEWK